MDDTAKNIATGPKMNMGLIKNTFNKTIINKA